MRTHQTPDTELELIWAAYQPRTLVSDVLKAVSIYTGIPIGSLISQRRTKKLVRARWSAFFIARNMSQASYPQIGKAFRKDHTTVLYGCDQMDELVKSDIDLKAHIAAMQSLTEKIRDERLSKKIQVAA